MTVLRVRARFAERSALSGRLFGVFGKREVGLGILVKLERASNAAVAALAVMMLPPAAAAQPAPAAPAPQAATPGSAPGMPRFIYTPWAKFCGKSKDAQAKQVCFTGKDARTEAGQPLVAAALIEPEGEPKRHCDAVPRRYPAAPQLRDDGSQLRCPRVGTRNKGFAAGLAGLRLPSDFHGFQGKGKTRAKGVEPRG